MKFGKASNPSILFQNIDINEVGKCGHFGENEVGKCAKNLICEVGKCAKDGWSSPHNSLAPRVVNGKRKIAISIKPEKP